MHSSGTDILEFPSCKSVSSSRVWRMHASSVGLSILRSRKWSMYTSSTDSFCRSVQGSMM